MAQKSFPTRDKGQGARTAQYPRKKQYGGGTTYLYTRGDVATIYPVVDHRVSYLRTLTDTTDTALPRELYILRALASVVDNYDGPR